jgi:hypothetical protein
MSYMVLSLLLSALYGFTGMLFFVGMNAPADNAFRVVWGSLAFWAGVAALAHFTVGWPSAACSIVAGIVLLALGGRPGDVTFTWGRALVRMGNMVPYLPTNWPLRRLGVLLKDMQVPLNKPFQR